MSWPQSQWQQPPGPQLPTSTAPMSTVPTTMANSRNAPPPGIATAPAQVSGNYPGGMPAVPPSSYTPAQYAALNPDQQYAIQQNWQQWQTYHQQYAQWHAQYGEQYQREMQAKLGMVAPPLPFVPPVPTFQQTAMPPAYTSVPPPPPDQSKVTPNVADVRNIVAATSQPPPPPPPPPEDKNDEMKNKNNVSVQNINSVQNTQNSWSQPLQQQWQQQQQRPPQWQSQQQTWQSQPQTWQQPQQSWTQPPPFQAQNQNMMPQNTFQQQPQQQPQHQQQPQPQPQHQQQSQFPPSMRQPPPQFGGQSFNQSQQGNNDDRRNFNTVDHENNPNRDLQEVRGKERDNRGSQDWRNNSENRNRGGNWQNQQQQYNYNSQQSNYSSTQRFNQSNSSSDKNNIVQSQQQFNQSKLTDDTSNEGSEEKSPEERIFDEQFRKWEEDFEKWKKENANHPDRKAYKEYEMKFEDCRRKLLERREQMRKRKLESKMKQQVYSHGNAAPQTNVRNNESANNMPTKSQFDAEDNMGSKLPLQHSSSYQSGAGSHSNIMHNFETALQKEKDKFNSDLSNDVPKRSFNDDKSMELKNDQELLESNSIMDVERKQTFESQGEQNVASYKSEDINIEHNLGGSVDHDSNQNKSQTEDVKDENDSNEEHTEKVQENVVEFLKTTKTEGGIPGLDLVPQPLDKTDSNVEKIDEEVSEVIDLETEFKIEQNQGNTDLVNTDNLNEDNSNEENSSFNFPVNKHSSSAAANKEQQAPRIPSLLDQKIEKPTFSPPRETGSPSFGQFLSENLGSNPFDQANINNPEFTEIATALSNPNVLALLTAALNNTGGDINKLLSSSGALNNSNNGNKNSSMSRPLWSSGQESFQNRGGYDGNRNMMGGRNDGGRGGGGNSWRDRQNNFSRDNRMNQGPWQGGGNDDFRRGNQNWNDNRRNNNKNNNHNNKNENLPFNRRQNFDADTRDRQTDNVTGSNTGPELMNEQSQGSEKSDRSKVNSLKDNDDNNTRRDNVFDERSRERDRNNHNQTRMDRASCDRSRSSSQQKDLPTTEIRNPRNPFRTEPRNIFDETSMSSGGGFRDRSRSRQRGDDYFRPAHVIDYQNKPLNTENDNLLFPTKVVDYGHKSSNTFGGDDCGPDNSFSGNFGGGNMFGSGACGGRDEFFPMKTIDYGHSSAKNDQQQPPPPPPSQQQQQQNQRNEQGGRNQNQNQNRRFNNNNNNNNQRGGGGGKNRRNKRNRQNRWAKSGLQDNNIFSQDTWSVGNENEKIPQFFDDGTTTTTTAGDGNNLNQLSSFANDSNQIENDDKNITSNEFVSEQNTYQDNLDEISENE